MSTPDQGSRLTMAEAEIRELRKGQELIFGKLEQIAGVLSDMRASSGPHWRDMLSVIRDGAVLFSLVVGGILYLANATSSRGNADLEMRLTKLEVIIGIAT